MKKQRSTGVKAKKAGRRLQRWRAAAIMALVGAVGFAVALTVILTQEWAEKTKPVDFPQIDVILGEDNLLEAINDGGKDVKYPENEVIFASPTGTEEFYGVELKGRGNSTWGEFKKPYQLKFSQKVEFLDLGRARKWALLADAFDATHLRNDLAFKTAEMLGMPEALKGDFVELSFEGRYHGLYYLTRTVNIGKTELDLRDSMGIIVEMDKLHHDGEGIYSQNGDYLTVKDVANKDNEAEAMNGFLQKYDQFERALRHRDFEMAGEHADLTSFANYYIISEFSTNPDAYSSSFFMYSNGPEDKIHAGPVWDFDFAFGSQKWTWGHGEEFFGVTQFQPALRDAEDGNESISKMFCYLTEMPEFRELVVRIWQEKMAGHKEELLQYIDERAEYIRPAVARDEARWKKSEFEENLEYLRNWVKERYEFLDKVFWPGVDWDDLEEINNPD